MRDDAAGTHDHEVVGVARGEVELMENDHDRRAVGAVERAQEVEHLDLVAQVQEGRRLVQQEHARLLREGHRDPDALTLAARQVAHSAIRQGADPRLGHRIVDARSVGSAPALEDPAVRVTAA
nr:hypothetical protein GCM10025699_28270 [Microbacterium flavescens]